MLIYAQLYWNHPIPHGISALAFSTVRLDVVAYCSLPNHRLCLLQLDATNMLHQLELPSPNLPSVSLPSDLQHHRGIKKTDSDQDSSESSASPIRYDLEKSVMFFFFFFLGFERGFVNVKKQWLERRTVEEKKKGCERGVLRRRRRGAPSFSRVA